MKEYRSINITIAADRVPIYLLPYVNIRMWDETWNDLLINAEIIQVPTVKIVLYMLLNKLSFRKY